MSDKTRSEEIEKTLSQLDKFAEQTSFTRTTAEGLYKREQVAVSFRDRNGAAREIQTRVRPVRQSGQTPAPEAEGRADVPKNDNDKAKESVPSLKEAKFSSTIPSKWSSSGLYRRNELGQMNPLSTSAEASELPEYLVFER